MRITVLYFCLSAANAFPHFANVVRDAGEADPLEREKRVLEWWDMRKAKRDLLGLNQTAVLDLPLGGGLCKSHEHLKFCFYGHLLKLSIFP